MNGMDEDIKSAEVVIEMQDGCKLLRSEDGIWAGKYGKSPAIVLGEREAEEDLIKEIYTLQQRLNEVLTKLSQSNNLLAYKNRDIEQLEQQGQMMKIAVERFLMFIEDDGEPVDGYMFRDRALKLRSILAEMEDKPWTDEPKS